MWKHEQDEGKEKKNEYQGRKLSSINPGEKLMTTGTVNDQVQG